MAITTTSLLPAPVQATFSNMLLSVPISNLIHNVAALKKKMPRNGGTTLRMRRPSKLATAVVPLGNTGITPPAQTLSAVDIDAVVKFYGSYVMINEQVTLQNQDPALVEASTVLGISLRESEDQLTRDMLAATASFIDSVGGTNGDSPTELTRSDMDDVTSTLLNADATMIMDNIDGADKFGTAPIRDAFFVLSSAKVMKDLDNVSGFVQKSNYPSPMNALRSEWGSVGSFRFLLSSRGSITERGSLLGADVYNNFVVGMESYGVVEQDSFSTTFIYIPPHIAGGPLALNCSVGYKFAAAPVILNDAWVINMRCTLS